ncbi:MAG: hypothetical protein MUP64_16140, partial [Anaerolineae bacterium]|nr:hypothetical protein [Anaerolineae bacterium]
MTTLQNLLNQHRASSGVGRLIIQVQIRTYTQQASLLPLLEEIGAVWDEKDLNVLIGAGMRGV